jgi:GcrA cell cycle regulator
MNAAENRASWTPERIERLKRLWSEGYSCTQIARELDCGLSRNAVIGKVSRMGLPGRQTIVREKRRSITSTYSKALPFNSQYLQGKPKRKPVEFAPDTRCVRPVEMVPEAERVHLLDLEPHHCRFPFGEGTEISFCGRKKVAGLPYCESHARSCFTAVSIPGPEVFREASKNPQPSDTKEQPAEKVGQSYLLEAAQ